MPPLFKKGKGKSKKEELKKVLVKYVVDNVKKGYPQEKIREALIKKYNFKLVDEIIKKALESDQQQEEEKDELEEVKKILDEEEPEEELTSEDIETIIPSIPEPPQTPIEEPEEEKSKEKDKPQLNLSRISPMIWRHSVY